MIDDIHACFIHLFESLDLVWMDPASFSAVIHAKGAALDQCWGFIDGTVRPISRPICNRYYDNNMIMYNVQWAYDLESPLSEVSGLLTEM